MVSGDLANIVNEAALLVREAGHASVALSVRYTDPFHRVSIPRSIGAPGYALRLPTEERYLMTSEELEDQAASCPAAGRRKMDETYMCVRDVPERCGGPLARIAGELIRKETLHRGELDALVAAEDKVAPVGAEYA
jgi:hypothetical protein